MKKVLFLAILFPLVTLGQNPSEKEFDNIFVQVSKEVIENENGPTRGVAWGDVDGDGLPELYTSNSQGQSNTLYKYSETGKFIKVAIDSPFDGSSEGISWVDYDNDGDLDLYICSRGYEANQLFQNDGTGKLSYVSDHVLTKDSLSSSMACWADYDLDGDLDVLLIGYRYNGNMLYQNIGEGNFKPMNNHLLGEGNGSGRTCACGDANNDALPEVFVGNARQQNFYYKNLGEWNFKKITSGPHIEDLGYAYGSSWVDFDDDGDLDLFIANFDKENLLLSNNGNGDFTQIKEGALVEEKNGASKGHTWGDYDNDGDIDLYLGNGTYKPDMQNFLYLNTGSGKFNRYTKGVLEIHADTTAGVAHADFDRDGDLDVFVANWGNNDPNRLYLNQTSGKNWVSFRLKGTDSNSFGIGTHVQLKISESGTEKFQHRWMYPITGYASQNDYELHFGLDQSAIIDSVKIYWPSGAISTYEKLVVNTHWLVIEAGSIKKID
ncbi:CRTAC1 family protein [Ekhidna sp.]|uniref:CRTAC1 family protein n=1 Tax=Ekhidna sp. TaxID=2608089 RepID=UPI003BAA8281